MTEAPVRILFLTPFHFGSSAHDDAFDVDLAQGLQPLMDDGVEAVFEHLPRPTLDGPAAFQQESTFLMQAAVDAEARGFDALVIGCCYDPLLTDVRASLTIPVIGPLETAVMSARRFGHKFAIVTDIKVAESRIADLVRLYGLESNCTAVTSIGWDGDDILDDKPGAAKELLAKATELLESTDAEVIVVGCTIVSTAHEAAVRDDSTLQALPILNTNLLALRHAQTMAALAAQNQFRVARSGYYA